MVDICKCDRRDCGKRLTCFRYLADSDEYGQAFLTVDKQDLRDGCDEYWMCRTPRDLAYMNIINSGKEE